ncbi:hypothetical protein Fcan01_23170 [Folsomia candida]|uniref:Uncharacterized protein n=1 Tax=Folsomia candida TaxID=158441 RepID=A0A226D9Y1_FOLCA|nr:hypothetical protein Fcan01_23170 [Folsomia candida]
MDVEDIQLFTPFDFLGSTGVTSFADYYRYLIFYWQILNICHHLRGYGGDDKQRVKDSKIASNLFNRLVGQFGMDDNMNIVRTGTFSLMDGVSVVQSFNKSVLKDFPIQPVEYYWDHQSVLERLQTCGANGHQGER